MVADTFQRMNASEGLSSVASFSLGLSMSMRGSPVTEDTDKAGHPHHTCTIPAANALRRPMPAPRKPSFQDLFPVQPAACPSAGTTSSTLAARRRRSSIDPTKLAQWFEMTKLAQWFPTKLAQWFPTKLAQWFPTKLAQWFPIKLAQWFPTKLAQWFPIKLAQWFPTKLAQWFPLKASGFLGRRLSRF